MFSRTGALRRAAMVPAFTLMSLASASPSTASGAGPSVISASASGATVGSVTAKLRPAFSPVEPVALRSATVGRPAASCTPPLSSLTGLNRPPACWRPYASTSPFNQLLPAAPKLASNSAAIVSRLLGFGAIDDLTAGKAETSDDYGRPVYFSSAPDPVYTIHCTEAWGTCAVEGKRVRIPAGATPASGSDHHLSVVDTASGTEYDFWGSSALGGAGRTLNIQWGGSTAITGSGLGSAAVAANYGSYAGVIRLEELEAGQINHALFMYASCDNGAYVYPATKDGQSCSSVGWSNTNAPPMGTRFQLNMTDAQIGALAVPAWKKTILTAMAHYGLIMGDTGSSWGVKEESGRVYTAFGAPDAWTGWAQTQTGVTTWEGISYFDLAGGVSWQSKLRVVAPCVSQATC